MMALELSATARRRLTVFIWLVGLVLAITILVRRPAGQIRALAWAEPVVVAAPEDGPLLEVGAALHDSVAVGEVVARLDPSRLLDRGTVLEAELESLQRKVSSDKQGRTRRFERDRESAALELAELAGAVDEGQARVQALREELAVQERLVAEGVAPSERAGEVRRELSVVQTRLSGDRDRLRLARRSADLSGARAATAEGSNDWQIVMARRRLAELDGRLDRLALRSSISGQITQVYRAAGEWLEAGEPVLRVSPAVASEVHAWLDSQAVPTLEVGRSAEIQRATGERLSGRVTSVGAERLPLPEELWLRVDSPEWGYLARIELEDGALTPGEPVQVGLRRRQQIAALE